MASPEGTRLILAMLQERLLPALLQAPPVQPLWPNSKSWEERRLPRAGRRPTPHSHTHRGFEICFVLQGEAAAALDGGRYLIHAQDLIIVPTVRTHDFSDTSADYDAIWIMVEDGTVEIHLQQLRRCTCEPDRPSIQFPAALECWLTARAIEAELQEGGYLYEQLVADGVKRLVIQVVRRLAESAQPVQPAGMRRRHEVVSAALELIHAGYRHELSVPSLARRLYVSPSQLNRLFRQETGQSVWQYVVQLRLAKARELLLATDLPVKNIASQVGYGSVHHFCRAFRRLFGQRPGEVRASRTDSPSPADPLPTLNQNAVQDGLQRFHRLPS